MNENIDLTKILKDCPGGWEFYSCIYGKVSFEYLGSDEFPVKVKHGCGCNKSFSRGGKLTNLPDGECCLFPSKEQRDWSKFTAPWYKNKNEKFDPNTLNPFDKVLVRSEEVFNWNCSLFSNIDDFDSKYPFTCLGLCYKFCIPYNDDTKHLIDTTDEAPEYYRYWEE